MRYSCRRFARRHILLWYIVVWFINSKYVSWLVVKVTRAADLSRLVCVAAAINIVIPNPVIFYQRLKNEDLPIKYLES